jgi:hypothetical protein
MRRMSTLALGATALALLAFVAAGCGGGGNKVAATTATEATVPTTTQAPTTEAATTQATTTVAPKPVTTTATATTSNLGGLASAKNCRELADLGRKFSAAFTGAANSSDLKTEARLLKQFADRTPSDIRADFEVLADYMTKVADAAGGLKPGQTPNAATIAKLQKLSTQIDQTKLSAASTHISAWVRKNCHS